MSRRTRTRLYIATVAVVAGASPQLLAADYYFVGPSGSLYSTPANWSTSPAGPGGTPPAAGDNAFVSPSSPLTLTLDAAPNNVRLATASFAGPLVVSAATASDFEADTIAIGPNVTFNHTAGPISANRGDFSIAGPGTRYSLSGTAYLLGIYVRCADGATFAQSGGSVGAEFDLTVGGGSRAAAYLLSGGSVDKVSGIYLDAPGAPASFVQTGGDAAPGSYVALGRNASYSLSAGSLSTRGSSLYIGSAPRLTGSFASDAGSTFTQTGGTVSLVTSSLSTANALLVNANASGARAVYSLSGGSLLSPNGAPMIIGSTAAGTFVQTGGSVSSPDFVSLGYDTGGAGTYSLSNAGTLNAGALFVGESGSGTFAQAGGTLILGNRLDAAYNPGASGSYTLSGGTVAFRSASSTFSIAVTSSTTASVTQTGGTVGAPAVGGGTASPATLTIARAGGSSASYSLSGTGALHAGTEYVGEYGAATFTQSGGTHDTSSVLYVAYSAGASATYSLSAGSLAPRQLHVGEYGTATLNVSGGALETTSLALASRSGSAATLNLTGGRITVLPAAFQTHLGSAGNATVRHSAGTLDTSANSPTVLAAERTSTATYSLSGTGALLARQLAVGSAGRATFTQTDGTVTLSSSLSIASNSTAASIYDLLAGSLSTPAVTNRGTFFMAPGASLTLTGTSPVFTNDGSATLDGTQSWPANSTFSNTRIAYVHTDPAGPSGTRDSATLKFTSASPDWAPVVFDAPATHLASLSLASATHATVPAAAAAGRLLSTRALSITDSAQLDLASNTLIVDYGTAASPADVVRGYLLASHLTSSAADATYRLGYLDSGTSLTVHLTLTGDANFDSQLNADDYALLDRAFAKHIANARWSDGDFNYDGVITGDDYLLIDSTYAQSHGLGPDFLAARESQFGAAYVSRLTAAVPEPTSVLAACGLALIPLQRRRRIDRPR